jgi:hypothetical protein
MSSDPTPPSPMPVAPAPPTPRPSSPGRRKRPLLTRLLTGRHYDDQIVVYRHTNLFYWWPVWLLGFVFAAISYFGDRHMAIVPAHTEAAENRKVQVSADGDTFEQRDVLILPKGKKLEVQKDADGNESIRPPAIFIPPHRLYGTIYVMVLLIVIVITTITLRGLWSVLVLMTVVLLAIILYLSNAWGPIFHSIGLQSIYINMAGYVVISTVLFALWILNFFVLDRMTYMIFTPGQVRVRVEIGGGEMVYDAGGMTVTKQRNDVFRHWGLGFGSGDLLIFPLNAGHAIEMPNVLRVGRVVAEIEQLVKEKVVVASQDRPGN